MRVLCDENVPTKYVRALEQEAWSTVSTVRGELARDAVDDRIAAYAAENDWVVFTSDDDFYGHEREFGLVVYSQLQDPRPRDVVRALEAIADAYENHNQITEVVPDGWT